MTFTCQQCGECCSTMGEIIEVIEEISPLRFRIGYTTTGEERIVVVDPDKKDLFSHKSSMQERSLACPFLCMAAPGRVICTVHASRPDLCRQYSCFRLLVLDARGNRIGKVIESTRILRTMDHPLREIWDREIAGLQVADEHAWEKTAERLLTLRGYTVLT
nr:YkgJ family cysteine cluster protein [uncultured Methanoregula sp.]